ncbi:MAG: hypothetical protein AAGI68_01655 [Planctomycetota bacterium]
MSSAVVIIPFAIIFLVIVGIISWRHNKRRLEALQRWADQRGWHLDLAKDHRFENRFPQFKILQQGSNRYAYEVLKGSYDDRKVQVFKYHYETRTTDSKGRSSTTHHHFSAALLYLPFTMPELLIRPEGLFDKLKSFFGFDDIDFESAEFSRRFAVKCRDRRLAYDMIPPVTMEFLLNQPTRYTLEAEGDYLLITNGRVWKPEHVDFALDVADGFLDRIPQGVVRERLEAQTWLD